MSAGSSLAISDIGPVRTLTIDRPERRNALDTATIEALLAAIDDAGKPDSPVRAVVVTGAGDIAFSSGIDLKEEMPADLSPDEQLARRGRLIDLFRVIATAPVPVVTRVNGVAMGGGVGLALVADVVVAADHAVFCTPEIDVGRWPMAVGAVLLEVAPRRVATDMMTTGRPLGAAEALSHGLVSRVVPMAELDAATAEVAETLARKPPETLAMGRRTIRRMAASDLESNLAFSAAQLNEVIDSPEAVEGLARFQARR